jgi:hypothetical protein
MKNLTHFYEYGLVQKQLHCMLASLQEKTIKSLEYQKLPKEAASWLYSTVCSEGRLFSKQSQANLKEKLEKHTMLL